MKNHLNKGGQDTLIESLLEERGWWNLMKEGRWQQTSPLTESHLEGG